MPLAALEVPRAEIPLRNGTLSLRGLTLDDVAVLVRENADAIRSLLGAYQAGGPGAAASVLIDLISVAPGIVAQVIAIAADEPAQVEAARRLSISATFLALMAIDRASFASPEERQHFIDAIARMAMQRNNRGGVN